MDALKSKQRVGYNVSDPNFESPCSEVSHRMSTEQQCAPKDQHATSGSTTAKQPLTRIQRYPSKHLPVPSSACTRHERQSSSHKITVPRDDAKEARQKARMMAWRTAKKKAMEYRCMQIAKHRELLEGYKLPEHSHDGPGIPQIVLTAPEDDEQVVGDTAAGTKTTPSPQKKSKRLFRVKKTGDGVSVGTNGSGLGGRKHRRA